ncbi:hypothetical protein OAP13_04225 [Gammaproteobacteria bacterium]|nr:hypothetical protein [Gammaproteobacteria bacterium]
MSQDIRKERSAIEAFELIKPNIQRDSVIGIGTGSTTNFFINLLNEAKLHIKGVVCSSITSESLIDNSYDIFSLNEVHARDFMYQEYNDESKVKEFCSTEYGVTFPMFATAPVKGKKASSFYKFLAEMTGVNPGWNFHKYLISKTGEVLSFETKIEPDSKKLTSEISKLL